MQVHIHINGQTGEVTAPTQVAATPAVGATNAGAATVSAELTAAMAMPGTTTGAVSQDGGGAPAATAETSSPKAVVATLHPDGTDAGGAPAF